MWNRPTGNNCKLTTLGRAVVLARGGSTRAGTASFLDAQSPALMNFTLKALLGSISLVRRVHEDESKATRLLRVRITHDVALVYSAILLEQTGNFLLGETGVDACDEQVRTGVTAAVLFAIPGGRTAVFSSAAAPCCLVLTRQGLTGCRDRWERHCGCEHRPSRDHDGRHGRRAETCCGRGHSHGVRLRVR
jgi:hypothetical protein